MSDYEDENSENLGDLPDDILHERGEYVYDGKEDSPISNQSAQIAVAQEHYKAKQEIESVGPYTGSPAIPYDVRSVYDVRPVNAIDTLLGGSIPVRVPIIDACPFPGNSVPLGPYVQDFGNTSISPGAGLSTGANREIYDSCYAFTMHSEIIGSPSGVYDFVFALSTLGVPVTDTFNAYGYTGTTISNGVLVTSNLGFTISNDAFVSPFTTTTILNFGPASVGQHFTCYITGTRQVFESLFTAVGAFFLP